ncbi:MAG TPA: Na+/H+ antiporter [Chloroflexia bacterium]|nr:Na+/H+ antiporter [Chloroflexia bacterium]
MEHTLATEGVFTIVFLLITTMVVAVASKYVRIPYTIALTITGLLIALANIGLSISLTPDLILFIFLPTLLFESSYNLRFADVRDNLRPITLLAIPGVILTAACVAAGLHYATGLGWDTAFLFGAIMSATDPVSVLAIFRKIGAPRRLSVILEGESLFNDGTSIVLFRIVLGVVVAGALTDAMATVVQFVVVVLGAIILGAAVGYLVSAIIARMNDYLVETTATLILAYGTYLLAEQIGVSGVIAVVVAALVVGNFGRSGMSPTTREAVSSTWEFFGFLANSLIFLLIGLELNVGQLWQYIVPTLIAIAIVLAVRIVVVLLSSAILRYIHRPIPYSWRAVLVWGGLRGSLALALALSIPITLSGSASFPNRDLLLVMTFGVILFSLLVQGLTMSPLLSRLGLINKKSAQEEYELLAARKSMALAAVQEIDRLGRTGGLSPETATKLKDPYNDRIVQLDDLLHDLRLRDEDLTQSQSRSLRRKLLQLEKAVVRQRNLDGAISDEPMRSLLSELDEQLHSLDDAEA